MSEKQDKNKTRENLRYLLDMLCATMQIYSAYYDDKLNLIFSNLPWEMELSNFFKLNCPYEISKNSGSNMPFMYIDRLHLTWIIQPLFHQESLLVLGPAFESDFNTSYFQKQLGFKSMGIKSQISFLKLARDIPVIPFNNLATYGNMLYYTLYNEKPDSSVWRLNISTDSTKEMPEELPIAAQSVPASPHGSRTYELHMLNDVRTGTFSQLTSPDSTIIGKMALNDPLRQSKNLIISQITLLTRAAVDGGLDADEAYSLSDYYIQQLELCDNSTDVYKIGQTVYTTFVNAVHRIKTEGYSSVIKYLISYINEHIYEDISLHAMAAETGYDAYYISRKFRRETGESINEYILNKKVEQAKILLKTTSLKINEISDILSFSSPSYFSTQFKRAAGVSPAEYK